MLAPAQSHSLKESLGESPQGGQICRSRDGLLSQREASCPRERDATYASGAVGLSPGNKDLCYCQYFGWRFRRCCAWLLASFLAWFGMAALEPTEPEAEPCGLTPEPDPEPFDNSDTDDDDDDEGESVGIARFVQEGPPPPPPHVWSEAALWLGDLDVEHVD